jgi:hypothetical protein
MLPAFWARSPDEKGLGDVAINAEEIDREKRTLPFGWGRFGKALEHLAEISAPEESLIGTCVALNPSYQFNQKFVPGTALGAGAALYELTKTTNVVLACTNQRLIVLGTSGAGGPRDHASIPLDGLVIASRRKKGFVLAWPDGEMKVHGAAKQQVPRFLDAIAAEARPAR